MKDSRGVICWTIKNPDSNGEGWHLIDNKLEQEFPSPPFQWGWKKLLDGMGNISLFRLWLCSHSQSFPHQSAALRQMALQLAVNSVWNSLIQGGEDNPMIIVVQLKLETSPIVLPNYSLWRRPGPKLLIGLSGENISPNPSSMLKHLCSASKVHGFVLF